MTTLRINLKCNITIANESLHKFHTNRMLLIIHMRNASNCSSGIILREMKKMALIFGKSKKKCQNKIYPWIGECVCFNAEPWRFHNDSFCTHWTSVYISPICYINRMNKTNAQTCKYNKQSDLHFYFKKNQTHCQWWEKNTTFDVNIRSRYKTVFICLLSMAFYLWEQSISRLSFRKICISNEAKISRWNYLACLSVLIWIRATCWTCLVLRSILWVFIQSEILSSWNICDKQNRWTYHHQHGVPMNELVKIFSSACDDRSENRIAKFFN